MPLSASLLSAVLEALRPCAHQWPYPAVPYYPSLHLASRLLKTGRRLQVVYNRDSSNVGPADWARLARLLHKHRDDYDAFLIIHGTDTMVRCRCREVPHLEDLAGPHCTCTCGASARSQVF